jgi:alpha-glucosidase
MKSSFYCASVGVILSFASLVHASPVLQFEQTDPRTYLIKNESTVLRLKVISSTSFRLQTWPETNFPEYIIVTPDESRPLVASTAIASTGSIVVTSDKMTISFKSEKADAVSVSVKGPTGELVSNWSFRTRDRSTWQRLGAQEHIYGFGDKRLALDQRGNRIVLVNRDAYASETNESYKNIPFFFSSAGYGLYLHNFFQTEYDIGASEPDLLKIGPPAGDLDFYFFIGTPKDVISQYTELTGYPAMLPRWSFGYHQAKASYDGLEGLDVAQQMRKRKLPVDAIYYDDWTAELEEERFNQQLRKNYRIRLTVGGNPFIMSDDNPELLATMANKHYLMEDDQGKPLIDRVEEVADNNGNADSGGYIDPFNQMGVRLAVEGLFADALKNGAVLGMLDFGELHHVTNQDKKFWPSIKMSVADTRNLFALAYPQSVMNEFMRLSGSRSTGMVRPGFAGAQRLGWTTTADSDVTFQNFRAQFRALLNLTLSGYSNVGYDIGGWASKATNDLYARWFAAGTFNPFMWAHGQEDHEPYSHGIDIENVARSFLELRYQLLPHFYSLHEVANRTGIPVVRAFPLQEPDDARSPRVDDEMFVGDSLLVAPVMNESGGRSVYLPKGRWYDFYHERSPEDGPAFIQRDQVPLNRIPLYVRAGSILPLGPVMQFSSEKAIDPLSVHLFAFVPSRNSQTVEYSLYEDDGDSRDYLKNAFQRTTLKFEQTDSEVHFTAHVFSGNNRYRINNQRCILIYLHHFEGHPVEVRVDGELAQSLPSQTTPSNAEADQVPLSWGIEKETGYAWIVVPRERTHDSKVEVIVKLAPRTANAN